MTNDDAISREDAIDRIARTFSIPKYEVSDCLSMLPSVQQTWVRNLHDREICPYCGKERGK